MSDHNIVIIRVVKIFLYSSSVYSCHLFLISSAFVRSMPFLSFIESIFQKTKIMGSGPITSWEIDGETVSDFILGGSKITADGNCSHEIKRHLLLARKVMTNLDSILKSRDITLPTKVCLSSLGYGFSSGHVWM